jgi:hypothetical protein
VQNADVSDSVLRIVPAAPEWVPAEANVDAAVGAVRKLCPGAAELTVRQYAGVTFIDQGGNFEAVRCPACAAVLETDWWRQQMDRAYATHFEVLAIVTPCCAAAVSLNDLEYDRPAGFARFEVRVLSPGRGWLSQDEMTRVSAALGTPVRQIMSHY